MVNVNELRRKKAALIADAEKLNNSAIETGVALNGAELTQYDNCVAEVKKIEASLVRHAELATFETDDTTEIPVIARPAGEETDNPRASKEYSSAFLAYVRSGRAITREVLAALNVTTAAQGGYATPIEFDTQIVERLINVNVMRQLASVITTTAERKILVENALGSADWAAEAAVAHNDDGSDDDSFSQVELDAYKLTRIVKVSEELLQDVFFDIQGWLARKFGNAFGLAEESAFVNGAGTTKPLGVVRSAAAGTTAHLHNDIATDELFDFYHSLKRAYRSNGSFLMNDSTALLLRKKKDGQGRYLVEGALQSGAYSQSGAKSDLTLIGKPLYISDFMPTADNAGNKAVLFGDFSYYTIADRSPRTFVRLNELYAANGQVGFRGVQRTDGKLTLSEAVVYLAMGAAS